MCAALAFHDGLDFVSVHETLVQGLRTALESARGRQSLESQVEMIVKAKAASLIDRTSFLKVWLLYEKFVCFTLSGIDFQG